MKKTFRLADARRDPPGEVRDEIEFHLAERTREFVEQGMPPDDARRAALASFGDVAAIEAELRHRRADRDTRAGWREWWESVGQDVRHALRALANRPLFAASTIAALAVGIGAAGAVFAVVNGVLLRPMPYADPNRLAMFWLQAPPSMGGEPWPVSSGFFDLARSRARAFSALAAFRSSPGTLGEGDEVERVAGVRATPTLFATLGVRPMLGRDFAPSDGEPGAVRVTMLSHALWLRRFGGDSAVLGTRVTVSGEPHEVIGVMPRGFSFPRGAELMRGLQFAPNTELWLPLAFTPADLANFGTQNLAVVGRLAPGRTPAQARDEIQSLVAATLREAGSTLDMGSDVVLLREQAARPVQRGLLFLLGAVVVVLLIACANVAGLLSARIGERRRELAVRLALGARSRRVGRQLVTEMLVLALAGGAGGAVCAWGGTHLLLSLVPGDLPRADDIGMGLPVLAAIAVVSVLCGLAFGGLCMKRVWATDAAEVLRSSTRTTDGGGARRGRRLLVAAQVALSVLLLVGAGLLLRSFGKLQSVRPGFEPGGAITGDINVPFVGALDPERNGASWARMFETVIARVAQLPGVIAVGAASAIPLTGTAEGGGFRVVGRAEPKEEEIPRTAYIVTEGDYFRAAGIRVLRGRPLALSDRLEAPAVAVVSRSLAEKYFPGEEAIGQQLRTTFEFTRDPRPRTIVGIVDDVKLFTLDGDVTPTMYVPEQQMTYPSLSIVVRTREAPEAIVASVRRELRAAHPTATLSDVRTLDDVMRNSLARQRFTLTLIATFATAALVLAVFGLYAVIAMSVQARRHELGVRLALGARPRSLVFLILREGMQLAGVGVVVGLAGALALSGVLRALLYGVDARDALVFGGAAIIVVAVAAVATWVPARHAARGSPGEALRVQ